MGLIALLVISIIIFLTLVALAIGFFALAKLKREADLLNLIVAEQRKTLSATLASAWDTVRYVIAKDGRGLSFDSSVVVSTIQDALLTNDAEIEVQSVRRWLHWPRYLAGMFVFIGLLGTVWGMAAAVSGLGNTVALTSNVSGAASSSAHSSSSFTIDQWGKLLSGIDSLLGGMNIAFRCTLFGLIATVLVSAFNSFYVSRCEIFEADLQRLISTVFLPLKQNTDKVGSVSDQVERLGSVVDKFDKTAVFLSSSLQPAATKLLSVAEKAETLTGQLQQATQSSREEAKIVSQRYGELRNAIEESYSQVEKVVEKSYRQVQEALAAVAALPLESYTGLKKSADSLRSAATEFAAERTAISETVKTLIASAARMEDAVGKLTVDLADSRDASVLRLETAVGQIASTLVISQKESNSNQVALIKQFEGTHRSFAIELAVERTVISETAKTVNSSAARMETAVGQLAINLKDAQKASNDHQSDLVKQIEGTHNALDRLVRRFELSLNDMAAASSPTPLREELNKIKDELVEIHRVMNVAPHVSAEPSRLQEQSSFTPGSIPTLPRTNDSLLNQIKSAVEFRSNTSQGQLDDSRIASPKADANPFEPRITSTDEFGQDHPSTNMPEEVERRIGFSRDSRQNFRSDGVTNVAETTVPYPFFNTDSVEVKGKAVSAQEMDSLLSTEAGSPLAQMNAVPLPISPFQHSNRWLTPTRTWQHIKYFFRRLIGKQTQ